MTALNVPVGAVDWPLEFTPQQATVASVLIAHVCAAPALTEVNVPAGTVNRPSALSPQQVIAPAALRAHVW